MVLAAGGRHGGRSISCSQGICKAGSKTIVPQLSSPSPFLQGLGPSLGPIHIWSWVFVLAFGFWVFFL